MSVNSKQYEDNTCTCLSGYVEKNGSCVKPEEQKCEAGKKTSFSSKGVTRQQRPVLQAANTKQLMLKYAFAYPVKICGVLLIWFLLAKNAKSRSRRSLTAWQGEAPFPHRFRRG